MNILPGPNVICILFIITLHILGALRLIKQQLSFFEAEVYCELHGGHLVAIHSQAENNLVHNLCDSGKNHLSLVLR